MALPGHGGAPGRHAIVTTMRRLILVLALLVLPSLGCATNQAHLDWRPGLSPVDFNGLYELSFAEYREFVERGGPNLLFDRWHGVGEPEAAQAMQTIGERVRASATATPQELAIVDLSGAGRIHFVDARGKQSEADVEWFAATPDQTHAVLLAGTLLGVVVDRSTIAIDIGSLAGPGLVGWQFTMLVVGDELTVFMLPEIGGAVAPDEPGYVFEFTVAPQASRPWSISVGRVSVSP
jgi:hypothetical protein